MRSIKRYVHLIEEELESAKDYGESYLEAKAKGNMPLANRFREMSNDELKHANYLHEAAVAEISELRKIYKPPVEMEKKWEEAHAQYAEEAAIIKQMLTL